MELGGLRPVARGLPRAHAIPAALEKQLGNFYWECQPTRELIELRNAVQAGHLVVRASSQNGNHAPIAF